jgi:uncharacterized phosphatase
MKRLYFIRHGESEGNVKRIFTGHLDLPLTKEGCRQAKLAAQDAKDLKIDLIVTSPLARASKTAEIVAGEINYPIEKIVVSDLFKERSYGDLHGQPYESVDHVDFDVIPEVETSAQLRARAKKGYESLKKMEADTILLCAHGTIGRAIRSQIQNDPNAEIEVTLEEEIPNAQIVRWI